MNIIYTLLYIYLLLKPYYFFKSGGIQISDIFLILSFSLFLLINKKNNELFKFKLDTLKENRLFLLFVFLALCINFINFINLPDSRFILATLYLIFNLLSIYVFSFCLKQDNKFKDNCFNIFYFNLIIQIILYIFKLGRYWDASRYMGTFNDPNQFGFYIFLSYSFLYFLNTNNNGTKAFKMLIALVLSFFLIVKSSSTGMLLGFMIFILFLLLDNIMKPITFIRKNKNKIIIFLAFVLPLVLIIHLALPNFFNNTINKIINSNIVNRATEKIAKTERVSSNSEGINIFEDRALDYIILYPQYILIGSGEGGADRFSLVSHVTEIHSTFPALLFYYGIIPFSFLLTWIIKKIKFLDKKSLIIVFALIAESFTLANQRQVLFWLIFVLANIISERGRKNE